jgi:uncharacterized NAD(P)/FAD-binding protein YdhS
MNTLKADVVIVGGGCSGVLVACQLLLKATRPLDIVIFEKHAQLGSGVAYATDCTEHILNVPNQAMSAFPEYKQHFIKWLESNSYPCEPLGFSQRHLYALYLRDCLKEAIQIGAKVGAALKIVHDEVVEILPVINSGWNVLSKNNVSYKTQVVILALGIFLRPHKQHHLMTDSTVAIIGSGLSMADAILKLKQHKHRGEITVFSRNGRLPLAHDLRSYSMLAAIEWPVIMSLLQTYKQFKRKLEEYCVKSDYPWQALMDSLRPYTQQLWQHWDLQNKQQFLRHIRSRWDAHRHRVAPQIEAELHRLQQLGFFKLKHAAVANLQSTDDGFLSYCELPNQVVRAQRFDSIIDCAGLISDYTKANSEVLQRLFRQEIIAPGPLNRGLQAGANGKLAAGLYTLGFALHGMLWESIAVPELRVQAEEIATAVNLEIKP